MFEYASSKEFYKDWMLFKNNFYKRMFFFNFLLFYMEM